MSKTELSLTGFLKCTIPLKEDRIKLNVYGVQNPFIFDTINHAGTMCCCANTEIDVCRETLKY